jgi:hypothetical protein
LGSSSSPLGATCLFRPSLVFGRGGISTRPDGDTFDSLTYNISYHCGLTMLRTCVLISVAYRLEGGVGAGIEPSDIVNIAIQRPATSGCRKRGVGNFCVDHPLTPNSVLQIAVFVTLCKVWLGIAVNWTAFHYFF